MVEYIDNSIIAQMSKPDMRHCVQYALTHPMRSEAVTEELDLFSVGKLTFARPDMETFTLLPLAIKAIKMGGAVPGVLNAANEIAVAAFLQDKISFLGMSDLLERVMSKCDYIKSPSLEEYAQTDKVARAMALEILKSNL